MSKEQTARIHRKYVVWCVVNGRPWKAIDDIGLKLIIAEWDPGFAATTPTFDTLDKVLREMYCTAKTELVEILQSARKDNKKKGYDGPFCSLQLDLTSKANVEYIAASVQLVRYVRVRVVVVSVFSCVKTAVHYDWYIRTAVLLYHTYITTGTYVQQCCCTYITTGTSIYVQQHCCTYVQQCYFSM